MCVRALLLLRCDFADGLFDEVAIRLREANTHWIPVLRWCQPKIDFLILIAIAEDFADLDGAYIADAALDGFGLAYLKGPGFCIFFVLQRQQQWWNRS